MAIRRIKSESELLHDSSKQTEAWRPQENIARTQSGQNEQLGSNEPCLIGHPGVSHRSRQSRLTSSREDPERVDDVRKALQRGELTVVGLAEHLLSESSILPRIADMLQLSHDHVYITCGAWKMRRDSCRLEDIFTSMFCSIIHDTKLSIRVLESSINGEFHACDMLDSQACLH